MYENTLKNARQVRNEKPQINNNKPPQQTIEVGESFTFWAMDKEGFPFISFEMCEVNHR